MGPIESDERSVIIGAATSCRKQLRIRIFRFAFRFTVPAVGRWYISPHTLPVPERVPDLSEVEHGAAATACHWVYGEPAAPGSKSPRARAGAVRSARSITDEVAVANRPSRHVTEVSGRHPPDTSEPLRIGKRVRCGPRRTWPEWHPTGCRESSKGRGRRLVIRLPGWRVTECYVLLHFFGTDRDEQTHQTTETTRY